jgi:hypothetical protein
MNAQYIAGLLRSAIDSLGGEDQALHACERMYSAQFRSEPFKLSEVENWQSERLSLFADYAQKAYCQAFKLPMPRRNMFECSERYCDVMDMLCDTATDWLNSQGFIIDAETLVVDLCNYKGEGEGLAMLQGNENLPIFISKNHSFFQANNF